MKIEVEREDINIVLNMAKYWLEGRYPVEHVTDKVWYEGRDAFNRVVQIALEAQSK